MTSGATTWLLVALGLGVVVLRRRSFAVAIVTLQALLLAALAAAEASGGREIGAAAALAVRAVVLACLMLWVVSRTREPRPVRSGIAPMVRAAMAVCLALVLTWLIPSIGLDSRDAERAVLTLVAFGLVTIAVRAATILQVVGIVLVENGLALAAVTLPGGSSLVIELGVAFDLTLLVIVAAAFHERIFAHFGAGDTGALRELRD